MIVMKSGSKKVIVPGGVDEYIAACPAEVRANLSHVRSVIREVAPDAIETVSYFQFPGYCYEGYDYNGMFVWFSYKKPYIRLHLRPPVIQDHKDELKGCPTTTGIVSFSEQTQIPATLINKLVTASLNIMKSKSQLI